MWLKSTIMRNSMVSLIMACTMLTSTAYAVQETKAADGRPCVIVDARGPTAAEQVQVLTVQPFISEVIILKCQPTGLYPHEKRNGIQVSERTVAPYRAQNKPSPCAAGLLRPGWRGIGQG